MNVDLKEDFEVIKDKHSYALPVYTVVTGEGVVRQEDLVIDIKFVRGSKNPKDSSEHLSGTLHEHLLACQIHDLEQKCREFPSEETDQAIIKLKEALGWLRERQIDRTKRNVLGEYKK